MEIAVLGVVVALEDIVMREDISRLAYLKGWPVRLVELVVFRFFLQCHLLVQKEVCKQKWKTVLSGGSFSIKKTSWRVSFLYVKN